MTRRGHPRSIGVVGAIAIVVASMIGTGVFTTTGFLVRDLGSNAAVLSAWAIGGIIASCGALAYAELVAALPENGGEYQLLGRIYHPAVGFVSGWVSLVVGFSAPIAASALAFGEYLGRVLPGVPPTGAALGLVAGAALLHALHVTLGSGVLSASTLLDVLLIVAFVAAGLWAGDFGVFTLGDRQGTADALASPAFGVGLIYVSFAYSGWNGAAYVAGEIRRPGRNLPLALVSGTLLVSALYLGLNLVFLIGAPASVLSGQVEVGHLVARELFGESAARAVSAVVALGLFTTVLSLVMTGPRVYERMGEDHPRLARLAGRSGARGPTRAIVLQTALAVVMVTSASFDALLTYMGFTLSLFSALTIAGVFVLRRREPDLQRPYRAWGHPLTTLLAIALMLWMLIHALLERPLTSGIGLATLAVGGILYWLAGRRPGQGLHTG